MFLQHTAVFIIISAISGGGFISTRIGLFDSRITKTLWVDFHQICKTGGIHIEVDVTNFGKFGYSFPALSHYSPVTILRHNYVLCRVFCHCN